jgi:hypothetical protein
MGHLAPVSERLGIASVLVAPLEGVSRVVGAVDVVVVKSGADVVGGRGGRGLGGGSRFRLGLSRLLYGRRRLNNRGGLGGRLGRRLGSGLGRGLNDGFRGGGRRRGRRRGRGHRGGRGLGDRRCRGRPGAVPGATEDGGGITFSHCDGDPFHDDVGLDVKAAVLEDGAGGSQDGAAGGNEC